MPSSSESNTLLTIHTSLLFIGFGFLGIDLWSLLFRRGHDLLARLLLCSLLGLGGLWLLGGIRVFGCAQFELGRRLGGFGRLFEIEC